MLHETSLALRREIGDTRGVALALNHLGIIARYRGDYVTATQRAEESLRLRRSVGAQLSVTFSLSALAEVARLQGNLGRAEALYRETIAARRRLDVKEGLPENVLGLAAVACAAGEFAHAARLLGASDMLRETTHQPLPPIDRPHYERTRAAIQAGLPAADFARELAAGRAMSLEQAVAEALAAHSAAH
jgi:hypothetical protein